MRTLEAPDPGSVSPACLDPGAEASSVVVLFPSGVAIGPGVTRCGPVCGVASSSLVLVCKEEVATGVSANTGLRGIEDDAVDRSVDLDNEASSGVGLTIARMIVSLTSEVGRERYGRIPDVSVMTLYATQHSVQVITDQSSRWQVIMPPFANIIP